MERKNRKADLSKWDYGFSTTVLSLNYNLWLRVSFVLFILTETAIILISINHLVFQNSVRKDNCFLWYYTTLIGLLKNSASIETYFFTSKKTHLKIKIYETCHQTSPNTVFLYYLMGNWVANTCSLEATEARLHDILVANMMLEQEK